jgi:hypothetical protein
MSRNKLRNVCLILLMWFLPVTAFGITLAEATRKAARVQNAKVLSAKTVIVGNARVHHIKVLTKKGVVKTVRIVDKSYRPKR